MDGKISALLKLLKVWKMVRIRALTVLSMLLYDLSLHIVQIFGIVSKHPLYPIFPLGGFISYDVFWSIYFGLASIIMVTILGSGVKVTTKNIINMPKQDTKRLENVETKLDKLLEVKHD